MRVVIAFETLWGNTERVARAIGEGLGEAGVDVQRVAQSLALGDDLDLLIVGGPTHAFSMSTPATRDAAVQQGATGVPDVGIREWIAGLTVPASPTPVATFDTRVVSPRLPGSAAKKAMRRLVGLGFQPVARPETFRVHGYEGPVAEGELERARGWGAGLAAELWGR